MAKSTHEKELERARARRAAERAERKRARTLVVALVAVLVTGAVALAAVLLARNDAPEIADPVSQEQDDADADAAALDGDVAKDAAAALDPCPAPGDDVPAPRTDPYDEQPTVDLGDVDTVVATLTTTCGTIVLELNAAGAPNTVANFVALAEDGYYEGVGFHRVINGFMIQGGDPTGTGAGCIDEACETRLPGYSFADELDVAKALVDEQELYPRGTLAMANAGPDTNGSQFFIVQEDPGYALPPAYTAFGTVLEGLDVVDRISLGPAQGDLAIDPVIILSVGIAR